MNRRILLLRVAQAAIALVVIGAAFHTLRGQWADVRHVAATLRISWGAMAAASALVLATYLILVAAWQHVVNAMGGSLRFADAAYVWFVSALARYAGALWQVVALSALARRLGAAPVTAAGAAVVMTIVNILTGFGVVLATGAVAASDLGIRAHVALAAGIAALVAAPVLAPRLQPVVARLTGRDATLPVLTPGAVWVAAIASIVSWLLYGLAFMLLTQAVLGTAPGGWLVYVSVYTTAYLAGLLGLVPAGVGVAEGAMVAAFALAGILTPAEALTVAVISRLWRTVLEIVPGLLMLAFRRADET